MTAKMCIRDRKERALNELVFKIKEYSIDKKLKNLTDITKLQSLMMEKNKIQNRDKTVSYTHLDVYKRQTLYLV